MMNKLRNTHQSMCFYVLTLCVFLSIYFPNTLYAKNITPDPILNTVSIENLSESYKKGIDLMNENRLDSALLYLTVVANTAAQGNSINDSLLAMRAYNVCGIINFYNKNYQGAYSNYKKAIKAGGESNSYWVYTNIAIILNMFGAYDESEEMSVKTYYKAREAADWPHLIHIYSNLLNQSFINDRLANISDIIKDYSRLNIPKEGDVPFLEEVTKGIVSANDSKYTDAIAHFKKASLLAGSTSHPDRARIDCATYIAKSFTNAGNPDSALFYLDKARVIGHGDDLGDHLVDIYRLMAESHTAMSQHDKAKEYMLLHYALKDSISSMSDFSSIKKLDLNYEVGNYENKIMQVNKEKEQSQRYLLIISITMIVFIGLFIIVIVQNRKLRASNKSLFDKNVEILKASDAEKALYMEAKNSNADVTLKELPSQDSEETMSISDDNTLDDSDATESTTRLTIPESEQMRIKHAIEEFFYSSEEWMQSDFSLSRLCEIADSNKLYVSQVINDVMGTNFHSLLNHHRINEARRRLLDVKNYGGMTIEAIAESLGYKSRSNFSKNFKKYTGLNPKEYVIFAQGSPTASAASSISSSQANNSSSAPNNA